MNTLKNQKKQIQSDIQLYEILLYSEQRFQVSFVSKIN